MIQFELDSNARRAQSDFAIHPTAEIFGETASLLSMTALLGRRRRRLRSNH
jgi:hypothetical protein